MGIREFKREFVGDWGRDLGRVRVAIGNGNVFRARLEGVSVFYNLFRVKIERRMEMLSVALLKKPKRCKLVNVWKAREKPVLTRKRL